MKRSSPQHPSLPRYGQALPLSSASAMSSMNAMTYYRSTSGSNRELNVGIIVTMVLIALLIFLELTRPVVEGRITLVHHPPHPVPK